MKELLVYKLNVKSDAGLGVLPKNAHLLDQSPVTLLTSVSRLDTIDWKDPEATDAQILAYVALTLQSRTDPAWDWHNINKRSQGFDALKALIQPEKITTSITIPGKRISLFLSLVPGLTDYLRENWPHKERGGRYLFDDLLTNPTDAFLAHAQNAWNTAIDGKYIRNETYVEFDTNGSHASLVNEVINSLQTPKNYDVLLRFQNMRQ